MEQLLNKHPELGSNTAVAIYFAVITTIAVLVQ